MHRISPRSFLESNTLFLRTGDIFDLEKWRSKLEKAGYRNVSQVMEHGEFAVRGAIIDLYPMGSKHPYRIDLFDDEIDSLRSFDPETQRSIENISSLELLPAREFPVSDNSIQHFRHRFREQFEGDPQKSLIYREVSEGNMPGGIEYYLPLFLEKTNSLVDYLPDNTLLVNINDPHQAATDFWQEINQRYQEHYIDKERPLLPPQLVFFPVEELFAKFKEYKRLHSQSFELEKGVGKQNYLTTIPPQMTLTAQQDRPCEALTKFIDNFDGRILFAAETAGRRETLLDILRENGILPKVYVNWDQFLIDDTPLGIVIAPLEQGLVLIQNKLAVIAEPQLFG
jgi:transcription-repair coupling factor (superfamily II helicase)